MTVLHKRYRWGVSSWWITLL